MISSAANDIPVTFYEHQGRAVQLFGGDLGYILEEMVNSSRFSTEENR